MTAQSAAPRRKIMTVFTIDEQNSITAFGSAEEAAAASSTPFDTFTSQQELADLAKASRRRTNARAPNVRDRWPILGWLAVAAMK